MQKSISLVVFLLVSTLSIIFMSCGDDESSVTTPPPGSGGFTLSGTITGYPGGSLIARAKLVKPFPPDSFFCGTDTVENNAQLSMTLVTAPTDFLGPIIVPPGIVISDSTAAISSFAELTAYNFSGVPISKLRKKNFADSIAVEGSFQVYYFYSTKAVTVTGSDTSISFSDTTITNYNISFAEGWNALSIRLTAIRPNFRLTDFVSGELSGASWRYETSLLRRWGSSLRD